MSPIDPERLEKPSASGAWRRRLCTGSENLIRELRQKGLLNAPQADPGALWGLEIHQAWAGAQIALNGNQALTLEDLQRLEAMVLADWASGEPVFLIGREQRLWLHYGMEPQMSGQYDVAYGRRDGREVLIMDAKTLYGEVLPAEYNDQLRELVGLYYFNHPLTEKITVAILAPKQEQRVSVAEYDRFEMELAYRLLRLSLALAADPDAPRTPGRHCGHCPAKLNCEEARAFIGSTYNLAKRIAEGEFQLPLGEKGARIIDQIKTSRSLLESLEARYKQILEEQGDAIPGWRLKEGKKVRLINETDKALQAAIACEFSEQDFWACCDLSIGRLSQKLGELSGTKGKALERRFDQAFGALVTYRQYSPELERVTKSGRQKLELA